MRSPGPPALPQLLRHTTSPAGKLWYLPQVVFCAACACLFDKHSCICRFLQDEIAYFNDALQSREEATAQLQSRFLMVMSLMRCLFAAAPTSHVVAAGCAEFLRKNQVFVWLCLH